MRILLLSGLLVTSSLPIAACNKPVANNKSSGPVAVVRAHLEAENAHDVDRIVDYEGDAVTLRIKRNADAIPAMRV